jgi:hypothetical protein
MGEVGGSIHRESIHCRVDSSWGDSKWGSTHRRLISTDNMILARNFCKFCGVHVVVKKNSLPIGATSFTEF